MNTKFVESTLRPKHPLFNILNYEIDYPNRQILSFDNEYDHNRCVNFKDLKEEDFNISTCGNNNKNIIDENIRKSKCYKYTLSSSCEIKDEFEVLQKKFLNIENIKPNLNRYGLGLYLSLLKYEKGDFFNKHVDGKSCHGHVGTILIYPPKCESDYEGGDLILDNDIVITADEHEWKIVILNLNVSHEVSKITSGTRYVFKCDYIIDEKLCDFFSSESITKNIEINNNDENNDKNNEANDDARNEDIKTYEQKINKIEMQIIELSNQKNKISDKINKLKFMKMIDDKEKFKNLITDFANHIIEKNRYNGSDGFFYFPLTQYYSNINSKALNDTDKKIVNVVFDTLQNHSIKLINISKMKYIGGTYKKFDNLNDFYNYDEENEYGCKPRKNPDFEQDYDNDKYFCKYNGLCDFKHFEQKLMSEYNDSYYENYSEKEMSVVAVL